MANVFTDWTSRAVIAARIAEERRNPVESWNELGGPGGLRPVPQDRVPDKAREVALACLHHLIESKALGP